MSKRSFKDIEEFIKNAAEAHEPAFDEQSWNKMEALLDKDKDRKKPFAFWWLVPVLVGAALISYFTFNKEEVIDNPEEIAVQKNNDPAKENSKSTVVDTDKNSKKIDKANFNNNVDQLVNRDNSTNADTPVSVKVNKSSASNNNLPGGFGRQTPGEELFAKQQLVDKAKGKLNAKISSATPVLENEKGEESAISNAADLTKNNTNDVKKTEEALVVKINAINADEKEIEKIVDSVITKLVTGKKSKNSISKFYIIVTGGAEVNGVKLFAADKITSRAGLAAGYQVTKNISIQTGLFISNKKYIAGKEDYKTKAGSYWNIVDIKSIDASCKVYEIPLQVSYDFTAGKKLNIFATAGLSSYIMKKEAYNFYYDRYGMAHKAGVSYSGNKSLFSVLRLSAGIEKKISQNFSAFVMPGIVVPLAGVGEGEVKLHSTDLMLGLKFSPSRKKLQ